MKGLYKIIIFFATFQIMTLIVSLIGVFPYSFYSDIDVEEMATKENPADMLSYLFVPGTGYTINVFGRDIGISLDSVSISAIISIVVIAGALASVVTRSFIPVVVALFGILFVPMITRSRDFFNHLFTHWNSPALFYLGICLGVGILILVIIHIIETPTHGDSG